MRAIALARGGGPSSSADSSSVAGRRRWTAVRTSRVVVEIESLVALTTPAIEAPVISSTAAVKRKIAIVWAPRSPSALETAQYSPSPTTPPRGLTHSGSHETGPPPGPIPSVPAARPRLSAANRQIAPALNGRTAGSTGRSTRIAPAAISAAGTT